MQKILVSAWFPSSNSKRPLRLSLIRSHVEYRIVKHLVVQHHEAPSRSQVQMLALQAPSH